MSEIQRDQKIFKLASKSMLNDVFTVSISLSLSLSRNVSAVRQYHVNNNSWQSQENDDVDDDEEKFSQKIITS